MCTFLSLASLTQYNHFQINPYCNIYQRSLLLLSNFRTIQKVNFLKIKTKRPLKDLTTKHNTWSWFKTKTLKAITWPRPDTRHLAAESGLLVGSVAAAAHLQQESGGAGDSKDR